MVGGLVVGEAALTPLEIDMLVRADQNGSALQILVAEIFSLETAVAVLCSSCEFRVCESFIERGDFLHVEHFDLSP